jgi:hypothetical protein
MFCPTVSGADGEIDGQGGETESGDLPDRHRLAESDHPDDGAPDEEHPEDRGDDADGAGGERVEVRANADCEKDPVPITYTTPGDDSEDAIPSSRYSTTARFTTVMTTFDPSATIIIGMSWAASFDSGATKESVTRAITAKTM